MIKRTPAASSGDHSEDLYRGQTGCPRALEASLYYKQLSQHQQQGSASSGEDISP